MIDEVLPEVVVVVPPVDEQVLRREGRDEHPNAVVDERLLARLVHPGVDDGVARLAALPGGQVRRVVLPLDAAKVPSGVLRDDLRVEPEDVDVELPPDELPAELLDRLAVPARRRDVDTGRVDAELLRAGTAASSLVAARSGTPRWWSFPRSRGFFGTYENTE